MCHLSEVLTVSEVAYLWNLSTDTILYHCDVGHIRWRDTRGGFRLLELESVRAALGPSSLPVEVAVYEIKINSNRKYPVSMAGR